MFSDDGSPNWKQTIDLHDVKKWNDNDEKIIALEEEAKKLREVVDLQIQQIASLIQRIEHLEGAELFHPDNEHFTSFKRKRRDDYVTN